MDNDLAAKLQKLSVVINVAREMGAPAEVYARLVELSALLIEHGQTTPAANLLAWLMHQPDVPYDVYDSADDLWIDLEGRLCPRVISDAKMDAPIMTLRGVMEASMGALLPPGDENAT